MEKTLLPNFNACQNGMIVQIFSPQTQGSLALDQVSKARQGVLSVDETLKGFRNLCSLYRRLGLVFQASQISERISNREKQLMMEAGVDPEKVGYCPIPKGFDVGLYWTYKPLSEYRDEVRGCVLEAWERATDFLDIGLFHSFAIWTGKEEKAGDLLIGKFFDQKYLLARWGKNLSPIILTD